jgi:hypothetical protein
MYWISQLDKRSGKAGPPDEVSAAEWIKAKLGFEGDASQERVLLSTSRRGILNCTRQWGKSTVLAAKAVHQAVTKPGSLILVVSPSGRQSGEWMRKAEEFARKLRVRIKGDGDNEISVAFPNGSRMVGLPGNEDTVRGFSAVSLLLVDEASRVSEELYLAVRPMLAVSRGTIWMMSTPYGKQGFFYDAWTDGGTEWDRVRVTAEECPRIEKGFLAEEQRTMGERWYRQEYGCEFVDPVSSVFQREDLERAVTDEVKPLVLG